MTSTVEVIVPWRAGDKDRERAWSWLWSSWRAAHPDWPVTLADIPNGEPWVKAKAVMPAIEASSADVVVVADADVWCDTVNQAVGAFGYGYEWAVPHGRVFRLTKPATLLVMTGTRPEDLGADDRTENPYPGVAGGGIVAVRRDAALDCPMDRRFVGWGGEDFSWGLALAALHGSPWRGSAPLWHLWHTPQPRNSRKIGTDANEELRKRYFDAYGQPDVMRALVNAGRLQEVS